MSKRRILVVDDDDAVLEFWRAKLASRYEVLTTSVSSEVLALARREKPQLILCDVDMPEVDGGDISSALLAGEELSSENEVDAEQQADAAGADRRLDDGVVGVLARRIRADVAQAAADLEVLAERMRDRDVAARGAGHPFLVARDELQDPHLQGGGAGEAPDAAQAEHQAAVAQLLRGGLAVGGDALHAEPGPAGADHAFEGEVALPEPVARAIADVREPDGARPVDVPRRAEEGLAAEDHPLVA